ncbi:MAG: hypothetical protein HQL33_08275 [Alphaproteobacteria bacterium]|nr:hypothetical protein [Alphaproteobacteria bacterium]MBF0129976.1 hypothetical protein [Alphaproteobacteria bacterium]
MSIRLDIVPEWESLRYGTPEERACFAAVGIRYGSVWLTEVYDDFVKRVREKAHLSAYRLAEWFAWNWWRLRWEPRTDAADWAAAHRLTTVGGGYVWPNVEIVSDGERAVLRARPTQSRPEEPLRYVVDFAAIVRAGELESALDGFVDLVVEKLRSEGIGDTNLHHVWGDVRAERADPEMARRRKIEALLGFDPDEADGSVIDSLIADASVLGEGAMDEVAANRAQTGRAVTAGWLREVAEASGFVSSPRDSVRLAPGVGASPTGEMPAWKRGVELADALREQERLGTAPISNSRLAQMAGVQEKAIADAGRAGGDFAFALDEGEAEGRVVLSSKWGQGRRFELARLVGDRIGGGDGKERLLPATKSGTYRQKFQRAFAAELLCPFDTLEDRLAGDYSGEAIEDAAGHFEVSSLAVRTILVNHKRLDRENIGAVF